MKALVAGALCAALAATACGPGAERAGPGLPGGPVPPERGTPVGRPVAEVLDADGGTLTATSADGGGALSLTLPAGALDAPTEITIAEVTGGAPLGLVGSTWSVTPYNPPLQVPASVALTAPAGVDVATLSVAHQDATGYWLRRYDVSRDGVAGTVTVETADLGGFALVTTATQLDLAGSFQLTSTQEVHFTAAGSVTLQYLGTDGPWLLYAPTGTITLLDPVPNDGSGPACAVAPTTPATLPLPSSVAELQPGVTFRWGINGRWDLDCSDGTHTFVGTNFDTLGITNIGCARSYTAGPVLAADHVQGAYLIDCQARGTVSATWDLVPVAP